MPELPEVETTCAGIRPAILNNQISSLVIRNYNFRWPIAPELPVLIQDMKVHEVYRRAKYIVLLLSQGSLILHLGMSGSLRVLDSNIPLKKHDHIDINFIDGTCLRLNDPRRFGAVIYTTEPIDQHKLFQHLGPEPLSQSFDAEYLTSYCRIKNQNIKSVIMNAQIVVGVGNIYANEALFLAGIHPETPAKSLTTKQASELCNQIKLVLITAIKQGGTTLKDFSSPDGKPGYFSQQLKVYGRKGLPCVNCQTLLQEVRIQNRSTVFCAACQRQQSENN